MHYNIDKFSPLFYLTIWLILNFIDDYLSWKQVGHTIWYLLVWIASLIIIFLMFYLFNFSWFWWHGWSCH